ncbi:MAG TPA: N-acetylmuramoyl-L-alanine amidase [Firmicutes bacterium]|nr:N-acetylmuramoyl-L-alanine amidase [Bacillota bacterium]
MGTHSPVLLNVWASHTPESSLVCMELTDKAEVRSRQPEPHVLLAELGGVLCLMHPDRIRVLDGLIHHLEVQVKDDMTVVVVNCEVPIVQPRVLVREGQPFQLCLQLNRQPVIFPKPFGPIIIDPACGGRIKGARGPINLIEKKLNLDVARYLGAILEQHNVKISFTRDSDVDVTKEARLLMAKKAGAWAMITLAMGSSKDGAERGTRVLYSISAKDSLALAKEIHVALIERLGIPDRGISPSKEYRSPFVWVRIEPVVLTNKQDEAMMRSPTFKERIARAIVNGLLRHVRQREMPQ